VHAFVFLSQLGRGGRKVHRDAGHTFVMQMAGAKIWEVFDSLPDKDNGSPAPIDKTRVDTGQIYYVPVGSPHRALADSKYSLHVTLSITEPPLRALVTAWAGSFTSTFKQTQWISGSREQRLAAVQDWTEKMIASIRGHSPEELLDRMENEWIEPKADWISLE
jgi:ribosomal protein L16 Arg81 hydroxylase